MIRRLIPTRRYPRAVTIIGLFVVAVLSAMVLSGCQPRTSDHDVQPSDPVVYVDRVTGCEYLASVNAYALTPRMGRDGKQVCK